MVEKLVCLMMRKGKKSKGQKRVEEILRSNVKKGARELLKVEVVKNAPAYKVRLMRKGASKIRVPQALGEEGRKNVGLRNFTRKKRGKENDKK